MNPLKKRIKDKIHKITNKHKQKKREEKRREEKRKSAPSVYRNEKSE